MVRRALLTVLYWLRIPVVTVDSTLRANGYVVILLWKTPKVTT